MPKVPGKRSQSRSERCAVLHIGMEEDMLSGLPLRAWFNQVSSCDLSPSSGYLGVLLYVFPRAGSS